MGPRVGLPTRKVVVIDPVLWMRIGLITRTRSALWAEPLVWSYSIPDILPIGKVGSKA